MKRISTISRMGLAAAAKSAVETPAVKTAAVKASSMETAAVKTTATAAAVKPTAAAARFRNQGLHDDESRCQSGHGDA